MLVLGTAGGYGGYLLLSWEFYFGIRSKGSVLPSTLLGYKEGYA